MATLSKIQNCTSKITHDVGSVIEVSWLAEKSSYTHNILLDIGNHQWSYMYDAGITSCSIKVNERMSNIMLEKIRRATGTITLHLRTFNEHGVQIGYLDSKPIEVEISQTENTCPSIKEFYIQSDMDQNLKDIFGENIFIKGHSCPVFNISAEPGVESELLSYHIHEENDQLSDITQSASDISSFTGQLINQAGTFSYCCSVENLRGFLSSEVKGDAITVHDYYSPIIEYFSVERDEANPSSVSFSFVYDCCRVTGANSATAIIEYKSQTTDGKWKQCRALTELPYSGERSGIITLSDNVFDVETNYDFRLTITDLLGESDISTIILAKLSVLMHLPSEQKGIGFGKHVVDDKFEVAFEADFYEQVKMRKDLEIDGLISGENFGRYIYVGKENCLSDTGVLTDDFNVRIYLIKPFNFVYFRMFINGLKEKFPQSVSMKKLCTLRSEFKPAYYTSFAVSGGRNCDVLVKSDGTLHITAWTEVPTNSTIYISGFYPLSSSSPLFVQNASKTITL